MDKISIANTRLKVARDNNERDYEAQIAKLDQKERNLMERLVELNKKKSIAAQEYGDVDAAAGDLVEINAGGKIVSAKRSAFDIDSTNGDEVGGIVSGRWNKKLQQTAMGVSF